MRGTYIFELRMGIKIVRKGDMVIRKIDKYGKITIPAKWRRDLSELIVMIKQGKEIRIIGLRNFKLTELFDSIQLSGNSQDWRDVKKLESSLLNTIFEF